MDRFSSYIVHSIYLCAFHDKLLYVRCGTMNRSNSHPHKKLEETRFRHPKYKINLCSAPSRKTTPVCTIDCVNLRGAEWVFFPRVRVKKPDPSFSSRDCRLCRVVTGSGLVAVEGIGGGFVSILCACVPSLGGSWSCP